MKKGYIVDNESRIKEIEYIKTTPDFYYTSGIRNNECRVSKKNNWEHFFETKEEAVNYGRELIEKKINDCKIEMAKEIRNLQDFITKNL